MVSIETRSVKHRQLVTRNLHLVLHLVLHQMIR